MRKVEGNRNVPRNIVMKFSPNYALYLITKKWKLQKLQNLQYMAQFSLTSPKNIFYAILQFAD